MIDVNEYELPSGDFSMEKSHASFLHCVAGYIMYIPVGVGVAQCLILSISFCGGDCPQAARNTPNDNDHVSAYFSIQMQLTKFASKLYNTDHAAQAFAE